MKVVIQHPSGAVYQGSSRYAVEWWERFSATHPTVVPGSESDQDEEPPQVVGLDGNWSSAQEREHEYDSYYGSNMPVVFAEALPTGNKSKAGTPKPPFGFVRNEENAK